MLRGLLAIALVSCCAAAGQAWAADGAQFVSQSVPTTMVVGQQYSVSVTMKNNGTTTWTAAGNYRLGSANPYDNWTWGLGRVYLNDSDSIAPNATRQFNFTVTAPSTPGTYNFQWRMVKEYVAWFGDFSTNVAVAVSQAANNAQYLSQGVPTTMVVGQQYDVSVTVKNNGTTTWTAAGNYRLGSANPYDNWTWGLGRVVLNAGESITPNATRQFNFTVTAPSTPGTYNFQWRMVQDGVEWFGALSPNIAIPVSSVDISANHQITKLNTQFSQQNFTRHVVFANEPNWMDPTLRTSLYNSMQQLNSQYVAILINGDTPPGDGSTWAFDFISPSQDATLNFTKLDAAIDDVTSHGMKPYVRYLEPSWVRLKYNAMDCSAAKIADLGGLYDAITRHLVQRYGTQTRNWIFSFDNERGVDTIGDCYCSGTCPGTPPSPCYAWDVGADYLSNYADQLAARIKAVDSNLKVAVWESFPGYNYVVVNYLINNGRTARLNNIDIVSAHGYADFGAFDTTYNDLRKIDESAGPAAWSSNSTGYTTRATYDLLKNNGLSRIELWFGENNLNSANDPRNAGVAGGLYYTLSGLKQGETGLVGQVRWWDIDAAYGYIDWNFALLDSYYAFLLLDSKVGFRGSVSYRQITPDNWTSYNAGSPVRVFAVNANGINSLIVYNIGTSNVTKSFAVRLPNPSMSCTLEYYKYNQGRVSQATQSLTPPSYSQNGGVLTFSSMIEAMTMAVFRFIQ